MPAITNSLAAIPISVGLLLGLTGWQAQLSSDHRWLASAPDTHVVPVFPSCGDSVTNASEHTGGLLLGLTGWQAQVSSDHRRLASAPDTHAVPVIPRCADSVTNASEHSGDSHTFNVAEDVGTDVPGAISSEENEPETAAASETAMLTHAWEEVMAGAPEAAPALQDLAPATNSTYIEAKKLPGEAAELLQDKYGGALGFKDETEVPWDYLSSRATLLWGISCVAEVVLLWLAKRFCCPRCGTAQAGSHLQAVKEVCVTGGVCADVPTLSQLEGAFGKLDREGCGTILTTELHVLFDILGMRPRDEDVVQMINELDESGMGLISLPDFLQLMSRHLADGKHALPVASGLQRQRVAPEQAETFGAMFHLFAGSDGAIFTADLGTLMRSLGQYPTRKELLRAINEFDADGMGTLSLHDFLAIMDGRSANQSSDSGHGTAVLHAKLCAFARHELAAWKEAFVRFDRDGDGHIATADLGELMALLGRKPTQTEMISFISGADQDGMGMVKLFDVLLLM